MKSETYQIGGEHYLDLDIQPWKAIQSWMTKEEWQGYLRGSAIAYLARAGHKEGNDALQDIKKAHHNLSRLLESFE